MALGKTVAEAKQLQDEDIVAALQGELVRQTGCPLAGVNALHKALEQYRDNHEETQYRGGNQWIYLKKLFRQKR